MPPKKLTTDEKKRMVNLFEVRYDVVSGEDFLFNIRTGETVVELKNELNLINRSNSLWRKREPPGTGDSKVVILPGVPFLSRCGVALSKNKNALAAIRPMNTARAAVIITASARGYFTRKLCFRSLCQRFTSNIDKTSGYLYYLDEKSGTTSWTKPRIMCASLFLLLGPQSANKNSRYDSMHYRVM